VKACAAPLMALAVVLSACSEQHAENVARSIESAAPALASDAAIVARIEARFVSIDADSAWHVAVESHDGAVSLSGKVRDAADLGRFARAASGVPGVKHVASRLTVDATMPSAQAQASDFALAAEVRANLVVQAGINGLQVGVNAKSGVVRLTGDVKSAALKSTILATVTKTPGVKRVVDELTVRR
jgi:hyperosmotically inducible protein